MPIPVAAVIDTNVFISACLGVGAANRIIAAALRKQFTPVMGIALFSEYEAVLSRHELFVNSRLSESERDELLNAFLAHCAWTRIYYQWRPNLRDEADNHLIELAVAAGAQRIVTSNLRDFTNASLRLDGLMTGLTILSPHDFLQELAL